MTVHALKIAVVVGEESGDQLGFKLMQALRVEAPGVAFFGVGGARMAAEGLESLFPLHDIAVMGVTAVIPRLPTLIRRVHQTVDAVVNAGPDALIIIDSPDFTHAVARRVRARLPDLPIIDYVSPSVWAWRSGRARRMRAYVDHVLAILPFEPEVHRQLGGPSCTYVGHPLIERLDELQPSRDEEARRHELPGKLLVMPGSRRSTLERMLPAFRATTERLAEEFPEIEVLVPVVPALREHAIEAFAEWQAPLTLVHGEAEKLAAFRQARAALVCSGTSTLELALSGVPMAVGYRLPPLESLFTWLVRVPSIVLPNLIAGRNVIPEFLHGPCRADVLAPVMAELIRDGVSREQQLAAFRGIEARMRLEGETPSGRAARIVLETIAEKKRGA